MSLDIKISLESGKATQAMSKITQSLENRQGLHAGIAEAVLSETRKHLDATYVPRNKRGDFWSDVRNSLEATSSATDATVTMQELGLRLRYYGGEVRPGKSLSSFTGKPTKALAVPTDKVPVVGGRQVRPGRAGLLAFIRAKTRGETVGVLVEGKAEKITRGPKKGQDRIVPKPGGSLLYTLRTITRHRGDKNIIPSDARLEKAVRAAVGDYLDSFED